MTDVIDAEHLGTAFAHLGLRPGHHVLVHSSLSSMGHVAGGAATVVRTLLDVVGSTGTVLAPTLSGNEHVGPHAEVVFDLAETPSWTGAIPATVRTWDGAVRSAHPTHSVTAIGVAARRLTEGHEDCVTPCGPGSPYAKLAADPDGMILLLGCDHESNTTLHHVEELAGSDYHLQPAPVRAVLVLPGRTERRDYWVHRYGTPRNFGAIEPLLVQRGLQSTGPVGAATARLMPAGGLVSLGVEVLRAAPRYFVRTSPDL